MDQLKGKRLCCDSMLFSFQLIAEGFSNFWAFRWKDESALTFYIEATGLQ